MILFSFFTQCCHCYAIVCVWECLRVFECSMVTSKMYVCACMCVCNWVCTIVKLFDLANTMAFISLNYADKGTIFFWIKSFFRSQGRRVRERVRKRKRKNMPNAQTHISSVRFVIAFVHWEYIRMDDIMLSRKNKRKKNTRNINCLSMKWDHNGL